MKPLTVITVMLFANVLAWAQPPPDDWSWTFQRNGETCGLLFEDANLTAPVKAVIRDDVCQSYSFVPVSSRFTKVYAQGHPLYGTFAGVDGITGNYGCAGELGGWKYKLHSGNKYFHIEKKLSDNYLEKIALTNQHKAAVGSLTNFLHAFNSTTTNNVNLSAYLSMWWSLTQEKPLSLTFSSGGDLFFESEEDALGFCDEFSKEEIIVTSILNFRYESSSPAKGFGCETVSRKRTDGVYGPGERLIYRKGKWRVVLPEF